jgi:transcriptional regulator with XRE-family HTH domain
MDSDGVRKRLRLLMALRDMNQKAVADAVGVSQAFVSAVLAGDKEPSEKICELVGVKRRVIYERCRKAVG